MCGVDYLERTSGDFPTALHMMREASMRLNSMFDSNLLTDSIQQLLDNASPLGKENVKIHDEDDTFSQRIQAEADLCSTQASSRRSSIRTSIGSSGSSGSRWSQFQPDCSTQWLDLTKFSAAEQYIFRCLGIENDGQPPFKPLTYEFCAFLLQLSSKPTSLEVRYQVINTLLLRRGFEN